MLCYVDADVFDIMQPKLDIAIKLDRFNMLGGLAIINHAGNEDPEGSISIYRQSLADPERVLDMF